MYRANAGESIRAFRETLGWTQEDYAARARISAALLSRLENNQRALTLPIAARLLRAVTEQLGDRVPADAEAVGASR